MKRSLIITLAVFAAAMTGTVSGQDTRRDMTRRYALSAAVTRAVGFVPPRIEYK